MRPSEDAVAGHDRALGLLFRAPRNSPGNRTGCTYLDGQAQLLLFFSLVTAGFWRVKWMERSHATGDPGRWVLNSSKK